MVRSRIEVLHVGSASRDLTSDDPRGWRLGGGVNYAALTTARLGLRTAALIGVDPLAASAEELELLRDAGVDLHLVHRAEGPVFDNRETPAGRVQVHHGVGPPIDPQSLPATWRDAAAWSLVPVAGEVGEAWASILPDDAYVVLGWQGMLRDFGPGGRVSRRAPAASALVRRADLVGVSRSDLDEGTSPMALAALLHPGADLVITEGRGGGLLIRVGEEGPPEAIPYPSTPTDSEVDPTGAGDTFLAALLATERRAGMAGRRRPPRVLDLRFAAAAGSLVVEGPGLSAVPDRAAVLVRRNGDRARRAVSSGETTRVRSRNT